MKDTDAQNSSRVSQVRRPASDSWPFQQADRTRPAGSRSGDQFADHMTVNVGEPEIATGMAEGEFFVIETKQLENRRVKIVNVDLVFHRLKAEFVGGAVDVTPALPSAVHPHGEAVVVVVPSVDLAGI